MGCGAAQSAVMREVVVSNLEIRCQDTLTTAFMHIAAAPTGASILHLILACDMLYCAAVLHCVTSCPLVNVIINVVLLLLCLCHFRHLRVRLLGAGLCAEAVYT